MLITKAKRALMRTPIGPPLHLAAAALTAPRLARSPPPFAPPYGIAGLLDTPTGLGEAARLSLDALHALGQNPIALDVSATVRMSGAVSLDKTGGFEGPGTLVVFLNAPEIPKALKSIGRNMLVGKRIVGFWHWELPRVPEIWKGYGAFVHEVFAPSRFVAEAVSAVMDKPVRIVVHPVRTPKAAPLDRAAFGLQPGEFVALSIFNVDSGFHRKNPIGAVRAFVDAFGTAPGNRLVLKTRPVAGHERELAALRAATADNPNILWLDRTMSDADLAALMRCADVLLSLHRSEGFGLVPSKAMLLGIPSVATNWSSTTDFLNDGNSAPVSFALVPVADPYGTYRQQGAVWAEPNLAEAAAWLRRLAGDRDLRLRLGALAKADAERLFSLEAFNASWR